jgi:hypothetical protein
MAKSRGQAIILVVLALLVLCLGLIVLFDTGQVVTKKVQLVNTADAAAYSAAVQEARALNLIAYMNRATVANEVAVAQIVSWYSWLNFAISATDHLEDVAGIMSILGLVVPPVEGFFAEAFNVLREAKLGLEKGRDAAKAPFKLAISAAASLNGAYSQSSGVLALTVASDASNVARNVVPLNDPEASIPAVGLGILAQNSLDAQAYAATYTVLNKGRSGNPDAERLRNVVMEARDPFSRQRDGSLFGVFKKYGGTDLVNYQSWVGLDTLNLKFTCPASFCGPTGEDYSIPLAWGGGAGVDQVTRSFSSLAKQNLGWSGPYQGANPQYATRQRYAPYSNARGNGDAGSLVLLQPTEDGEPWIEPGANGLGATLGLPDYRDVAKNRGTVPYENGKSARVNGVSALDVGPEFTVVVEQATNTVRTSSHVSGIGGPPDFQTNDQASSYGMTATASAQVYFSRPRGLFQSMVDPGREMGSLFSPYWHARLMDTRCSIRQEIAARYGALAPCI